VIYLDNAATSWPKPESVYRAMDEFARLHAGNPGRSGHRMALEAEKRVQDCRAAIARLLNASSPDEIVLTLNATDALNIAMKGFLQPGDHVVTSHTEHNSINRPLTAMARAGTIAFAKAATAPDGSVPAAEIAKALTPKTRLVAVTHCSNVLGVVNPLEDYAALAKSRGVALLIDASQSVGVVPIDVRKTFDGVRTMVAFPGHKNLFGPMGTGALYVGPGIELRAWREGGTGFRADEELQPDDMPFHLEGGTPNAHGYAALAAGLEFVLQEGVDKILKHERSLALRFIEAIRGHPKIEVYSGRAPDRQIGPVAINVRGVDPNRVGAILDKRYSIACRPGLHCAPGTHRFLGTFPSGAVRFSFGCFNVAEHADAAAKAVRDVADGKAEPAGC
jgi:cysteine desulfurase family protein